jgi:monoamine oxidase
MMQADKAARELDAIFPGLSAARDGMKQARMHWPTHPWTLGSYACYRPGQWTSVRGAPGEAVGNLHFAGEHCALDNQGFMEGGCESGELAAQAVLAQRGIARAA